MKHLFFLLSLLLSTLSGNLLAQKIDSSAVLLSQPVVIEDDDWKFEGTQNMILVPENRNEADSRLLTLQFFKFPAREKSNLPPVVFLGAGPGEPYSVEVFYNGARAEAWRYELNFVNQKRDVILINQRGNSDAPGLQINNFRYRWHNGGSLDKPLDLAKRDRNRKEAYAKYIKQYTSQGIDLRGYDILHFVDDIEAVRLVLGYSKIALVGNSFASQWALGYIQRYPQNIDRALFSGVEPLDHNYDDPQGFWEVLKKIDAYAQADPQIASDLPEAGLIEAFKTIITRLEEKPVAVQLQNEDGDMETIVVGADDLRFNLINPDVRSYVAEIESWPKYITEMYNGDFRFLAGISVGRIYNSSTRMTDPLFNNSLGVSPEREAMLNQRPAKRWLGDVNDHYMATRDISPTPVVPDDFRKHVTHDIPMVLIQGDMDMSTPYENALFLTQHLNNGYLLTVKRGFHNAKRALIFADSSLTNRIYEFMNVDFSKQSFQDFKSSLPTQYELPEFTFWAITGESLYDRYLRLQNE